MAADQRAARDLTSITLLITDELIRELMRRGLPRALLLRMQRVGARYCPWSGKFVSGRNSVVEG